MIKRKWGDTLRDDFIKMPIAIILGLGVSLGLRWLVSQMGYTDAQINGAGGIGIIIAGIVTIVGFLKITQKRDDTNEVDKP